MTEMRNMTGSSSMARKPNWRTLRTPHGPATKVPALIRSMSSPSSRVSDISETSAELRGLLVSNRAWTTASAPALALSLDSRAESLAPEYHIWLAADILAGGCKSAWISGSTSPPVGDDCYEACVAAMTERKDSLLTDLQSQSPQVRAAVAGLLGAIPSLRDELLPLLEERFEREQDSFARTTLMSSLEMLDKTERWKDTIAQVAKHGHSDHLLWGVAALSWLRESPQHHAVDVIPAIEAWLSLEVENRRFLVWQDLTVATQCSVLAGVLKHRDAEDREDALDALVVIGRTAKTARVVGHLGSTLSQVLDRPASALADTVIPARALTPELRRVAEGLVDSLVYPVATWMPAGGSCRRRWLGMAPPSVLERAVRLQADAAEPLVVWEAWRELEPRRKPTALLPLPLASALNAKDQWRAAVEYYQDVYGSAELVEWSTLTAAIESLVVDDETDAMIVALCHEALVRQQLVAWLPRGGPIVSRLLLLPLVRAGVSHSSVDQPVGDGAILGLATSSPRAVAGQSAGNASPSRA
jgi:hypothetical protein